MNNRHKFLIPIIAVFVLQFFPFLLPVASADDSAQSTVEKLDTGLLIREFTHRINDVYKATKTNPEVALRKAGDVIEFLREHDGKLLPSSEPFNHERSSLLLHTYVEMIRALNKAGKCDDAKSIYEKYVAAADSEYTVLELRSEYVFSPVPAEIQYSRRKYKNRKTFQEQLSEMTCLKEFDLSAWHSPYLEESEFFSEAWSYYIDLLNTKYTEEELEFGYSDVPLETRIEKTTAAENFYIANDGLKLSGGRTYRKDSSFMLYVYLNFINIYDKSGMCDKVDEYKERFDSLYKTPFQVTRLFFSETLEQEVNRELYTEARKGMIQTIDHFWFFEHNCISEDAVKAILEY